MSSLPATGFKVDAFMRPMTITGADGMDLDEVWAQRPSAYMAITIPGFPNFFMLNGPNSPVGNFSLIQTAELQFEYAMDMVERVAAGQLERVQPTEDAAHRFVMSGAERGAMFTGIARPMLRQNIGERQRHGEPGKSGRVRKKRGCSARPGLFPR